VAVAGLAARFYEKNPERLSSVLAALPRTIVTLPGQTPASRLPEPANRTYPRPGVEEAGAPLGVAPVVAAPSGQFTFTKTQVRPDGRTVPVTFSPCRPIHYVINPAGAPAGFTDQVVLAMADLSAATGLQFIADGVTTEPPAAPRTFFQPNRYGDRWVPVLIAISNEQSLSSLAGNVAGVGGYVSSQDRTTGLMVAVTGDVYLDSAVLAQPPVRGLAAYVPVLRHELAHLVGLNHIDDPTQLMNPSTTAVVTYQGGDLTGLAQLGRGDCAPGV
jgi:hypothetical protein